MKSTILVLLSFFVAANLHAQVRRRSGSPPAPLNGGVTVLDPTDPFAVIGPQSEANSAMPAPASPAANPVPVSQLRIPSKAAKEFERSQKAFQSGALFTSVEHLQRALQIFPDFTQAHLALGLRLIQLGEYQKALTEHEAAVSLDPRSAQAHQDLSLTLLLLNRYQEAEAEARQSLDTDSQAVAARYVLGRALVGQDRITSEAMDMLRQSENVFPNASLVLAVIHFRAGQTEQTIAELRNYLRAPVDADNKQKAECWVAQLSQQPSLPAGCPAESTQPAFR
jgi:tetratricopeptide (TPR) repeat protein